MTSVANITLLAALFALAPAGVLWCCSRIRILGKIGPVLILYIIGIAIGNSGLMPDDMAQMQEILSSATVPLAIPLMLFGCTLRRSITRSQMLALVTGLISVVATVAAGYLIFGSRIEQGARIGGMLTGVYTGGTINLAALKAMLGVNENTYILINSYDMLVSFLYLTFLLSAGIKLFRKVLPFTPDGRRAGREEDAAAAERESFDNVSSPYSGLFTRRGMKSAGTLLALTLAICAVSGGVALLLPQSLFMTVFILMLTTLGIGCSFCRRIREMRYGYDIGMYLIYIFCITVASMANLSEFDLAGGIMLLGYLSFIVFGSLLMQVLFAVILRIDADTVIISSVAFINSPPFVPMISAAMRNRNVLVGGLTIGIIGYATGNYLGFLMAELLSMI
ncbi:MAG: DUF819 family protein [Alistipes sp.]|nr:DUF819 family protein [Alistipes sp.]